jgi:hypothetical protein
MVRQYHKFSFSIIALAAFVAVLSFPTMSLATIPNPTAAQTAQARAAGFCADPWVTLAIWFETASTRNPNGIGNLGECNIQLYNGGSWNSYDQLVSAVSATMRATNGVFSMSDNHDGTLTIVTNAGGGFSSWAQVTGRIVATGAGNIVASGAGNIILIGGSNIILIGGSNYRLTSVGQKAIMLPGGHVLVVTGAKTPPRH